MEQPNVDTPAISTPSAESDARTTRRRIKLGRVASDKMDKTIVVVTETRVPHL
jgi:hypothetical protein